MSVARRNASAAGSVPAPDLSRIPGARLQRMLAAGEEALECQRVLEKAGLNLVGEVLRGHGEFYELAHYPPDDVLDRDTHSQYYYHAHGGIAGEHGHFHTFLRAAGMPEGAEPIAYAGDEPWPRGDDALSHLVAVSMDPYGRAMGLFCVNRWVTGDTWYSAADVVRMLPGFRIDHAQPSWPVNRWLTALFELYFPHMAALLMRRDTVVEAWARAHPERDVFEDRQLELTGWMPIDVEADVRLLRERVSQLR
jgi:hypothetical protein